jgi:hypothetical protein
MRFDPKHTANRRVLEALREENSSTPEVMSIEEVGGSYVAYFECGSHPEIVKHVWERLGKSLPDECCCLIHGTPTLVHDESGVVMAVCFGTQYAVRVLEEQLPDALAAGCRQVENWGGRQPATDLREGFGPDWVFGCFDKGERKRFRVAYARYSPDAEPGAAPDPARM